MKYDYLIVGAGLSGSVLAERIASQLDRKVLVIDKKDHIAGHCYDFAHESGIMIHKFGPHIFHTNVKKVWDYLSNFTGWHIYFHKVLAVVEGKKIPIPFNLNSIYQIFPAKYAEKLEDLLIKNFGYGLKIPILKLKHHSDTEINFLADFIYKNVFLGYTLKQWDLKPEELDFSVTSRVPVYISRDDRYFQDTYQGIPMNGYTEMVKSILNHKNITLLLKTDYNRLPGDIQYDKIIFTGPVDEFFEYKYGNLPYRSLRFEYNEIKKEFFQEVAQVNYPNNYDFTRITEFKHFLDTKSTVTIIAKEYSETYEIEKNEPYYPIPRKENEEIYNRYLQEVDKISKKVLFVGRLADYKYYNMDQTVAVALSFFEKNIAGE